MPLNPKLCHMKSTLTISHSAFFRLTLIQSAPLRLDLPLRSLNLCLLFNSVCNFRFTIRTTCPAQLFLPVLIFGESTYYSVACHFLSLKSKHALQHPVLKHPKYIWRKNRPTKCAFRSSVFPSIIQNARSKKQNPKYMLLAWWEGQCFTANRQNHILYIWYSRFHAANRQNRMV
jgi:hypothetical protein